MTGVDWERLRTAAREVTGRTYVPYSDYRVNAAALMDDGRIMIGCNVGNAPYGVGLYAKCGLVLQLSATGGGRLVAFICRNKLREWAMPCGRCRQPLFGSGGNGLLIDTPVGMLLISEVLPQAFGPADLDHAR